MINLISDDKKKSHSNETKLQKATDGGRSKAQQPTPQQTHQLHVQAWAAEAKIAEAVKSKAMEAEEWKAAIAFVPDQERIPRTSERTPRTKERIRQRINEKRTNFRKNLIWERTPVKTVERIPERYDDEDMDPRGTVET